MEILGIDIGGTGSKARRWRPTRENCLAPRHA